MVASLSSQSLPQSQLKDKKFPDLKQVSHFLTAVRGDDARHLRVFVKCYNDFPDPAGRPKTTAYTAIERHPSVSRGKDVVVPR